MPTRATPQFCVTADDIIAARARVSKSLHITPLTHSPAMSEVAGRQIFFKWDNKLKTGSFKERGAVNFLALMTSAERKRGVCAASAGNHALALSHHAQKLRVACTIVMPVHAPLVKVQSTQRTGATVVLHGSTFDEAREYAEELGKERGLMFVPAFDDARIIAGQGTIALEIAEQCSELDCIVVPIGGGGLAAGIATVMKSGTASSPAIIGVRSEWAERKKPSQPSQSTPLVKAVSIADGIAVKRQGQLTTPIIEAKVDQVVTVSEDEIADSIVRYLELERTVIEGAGAASLAALLAGKVPARYRKIVVVACGSNIDMNLLSRLIERDMGKQGRLARVTVSLPDRPGALHTVTALFAAQFANVLQVSHDRSFSHVPGDVNVTFVFEVRDAAHRDKVLGSLTDAGLSVTIAQ